MRTWYSRFRVEKFTSGRRPLFSFMSFMRASAENGTTSEITIAEPREFSSPELERHLGEEIRKHAARIILGLVQKAVEGGAVQAKFLFDFAGLAPSPQPESKGESLLTLIQRELRLQEPPEGTVE